MRHHKQQIKYNYLKELSVFHLNELNVEGEHTDSIMALGGKRA